MAKRKKPEEQYFVEVIKQARVSVEGTWEYFVKWYGYDDEEKDNTWEPAASIDKSCKRLIGSFWSQFPDDPTNPDPDFVVGQTLTPSARWIAQEKKLFKKDILKAPDSDNESGPPNKKRKTSTSASRKASTPVASSSSSIAKPKKGRKKPKTIIQSDSSDSDEPLSKKHSVPKSSDQEITVKNNKGKMKVVDTSATYSPALPSEEPPSSVDPSSEISTPAAPARPALPRKNNRVDAGRTTSSAAPSPVITDHVPPALQRRPSLPHNKLSSSTPARSNTLPDAIVSALQTQKNVPSGSTLSTKQRLSTMDAIRPIQVKNVPKTPAPINTTISSFTAATKSDTFNALRSNNFKKANAPANARPGISTPVRQEAPPVQTAPITAPDPEPALKSSVFSDAPFVESPIDISVPEADPFRTQAEQFLSSVMPPKLAAPLRPAQTPVNETGMRPILKPVPTAATPSATQTWSWSGSLALSNDGQTEPVCPISIINPTQAVPLQMPLKIAIGSKDTLSLKLYRSVDVPLIIAACKPASQFAQVISQDGEGEGKFQKMLRFMSEKRMVGLLQIEREGHILICSPSARLSGLNIPIELRGSQNLVAIALQWKLPPGEVREFNWTLLPGAPSTKSFPNATTSSSVAVQRAIRVLGFPEWLHNWLQSSTKRPFCVCSEGGDGSKNKIGMSFETEALYAILRQYKSAQDVGVLSDVRTLFIHVSCLKSLHKVKGLVQRRKRNLTTMFFLYGSHPESDRSLWGMREIFPIGGIMTFDTTTFVQDPLGTLMRMNQAIEHPLWATYIIPSVLALATKLVYKEEDPLAALDKGDYVFDFVISAILSKKVAFMQAPPDRVQIAHVKGITRDDWFNDQLGMESQDSRKLLETCLKDFEAQYGRETPETYLRVVRDAVTRDVVKMQCQLELMTTYRRFVVLLARSANETSDSEIVEYATLSSFQWMDDYFSESD